MTTYNPPDCNNKQNGTGQPINKFTICNPKQRDSFIAMVQPLFSSVLAWGEETGEAPYDFDYSIDTTDTRRKFGFKSKDDTSVQFQLIGPYLELMFANGVGAPGSWYWRKVVEVGGKTPGKVFPSKLDWKPGAAPAKDAPIHVETVDVNVTLSQLIAGE